MSATSEQAGADGVTRIVEVGAKPETDRVAVAECVISMTPEAVGHLLAGTKKGEPDPDREDRRGDRREGDAAPAAALSSRSRVTGAEMVIEPDPARAASGCRPRCTRPTGRAWRWRR